jgi:mycofactocin precursor
LEPVPAGSAGRRLEEPVTTTQHTAVPRVTDADPDPIEGPGATGDEPVLVEDELLVEDVSIDGMCGVY